MKRLPLAILFIVILGCDKNAPVAPGLTQIRLGEAFTMRPGETAYSSDGMFTLRFDSVLEDSRCPEGMMCIWAGQAVIALTIDERCDTMKAFTELTEKGFSVLLKELYPNPPASPMNPKSQYLAEFIVTKILRRGI